MNGQKNNKNKRFIFNNAWNEWGKGAYLESDRKYGYNASINFLLKALFKLPYKEINIIFSNFNKESIIAIQVQLFYDDLISEKINKTNNIPLFFDLFISTNFWDKKRK